MKIIKFLKYLPIGIVYYFLFFFLIYIISGFLLLKGITPDNRLINTYQTNFYLQGGLRNIWQSNKNCVEFDKDLIFIPKKTSCNFKNLEFDTKITFDKNGRYSDHPNLNKKSIAVIGDSFSMGWGVNDDETFSSILEKKINRPVFNLAVSGYGTVRQLMRLEKTNLLDKIDIIILQYCYNDVGENMGFKKNSEEQALQKFNTMVSGKPVSNWRILRKVARYSSTIPIDILRKKNEILDFSGHHRVLKKILSNFPSIKDKKIYIFYTNGPNMKFSNFPFGSPEYSNNIFFLDIKNKNEHFFKIDGHLNRLGHKFIAEELSKVIN